MKAGEIRKLTPEEMELKVASMQQELFNLRFRHKIGQLENPKKLTFLKRDIARLMTIKNESRMS
ncbi:MAG: 50S ribosomal protein L29 [Desulfatirhabdiaceae bacterium]|jgi:large subunit ribosomal protein L29|nr:50S ribosomal protein L29 [Desulfatirhabdiaceae bacterium]